MGLVTGGGMREQWAQQQPSKVMLPQTDKMRLNSCRENLELGLNRTLLPRHFRNKCIVYSCTESKRLFSLPFPAVGHFVIKNSTQ